MVSTCRRRWRSDSELTLTIAYAGRLEPQTPDAARPSPSARTQPPSGRATDDSPAEPSFLYSSRSCWYPQAPVSDYATATHHDQRAGDVSIASPAASSQPGLPQIVRHERGSVASAKSTSFTAAQPLRYLAFIVSRFARVGDRTVARPICGDTARRAMADHAAEPLGRGEPAPGAARHGSRRAPPTSRCSTRRSSATSPYSTLHGRASSKAICRAATARRTSRSSTSRCRRRR